MAAGGSGKARLTDSNPRTMADRQPSRLSASEGMLNPSTRVSPPRSAPNFRLVPPASSVITIRRSFSNGIGMVSFQGFWKPDVVRRRNRLRHQCVCCLGGAGFSLPTLIPHARLHIEALHHHRGPLAARIGVL